MQQLKFTTTTTSIYYRAWAFIISYGPETPIYLLQPIICSECFDCMTPNIHGQSILQFTRRTRMGIGHARWAPLNLENKHSPQTLRHSHQLPQQLTLKDTPPPLSKTTPNLFLLQIQTTKRSTSDVYFRVHKVW